MSYGRPPLPDEPGHPSFRTRYVTHGEMETGEGSANHASQHLSQHVSQRDSATPEGMSGLDAPAAPAVGQMGQMGQAGQDERAEQARIQNVRVAHTQDNVTVFRNRRTQTILTWVMWGTAVLGISALFAVLLSLGSEPESRDRRDGRDRRAGDDRSGGSRGARQSADRSVDRWAEQFFDDDEGDEGERPPARPRTAPRKRPEASAGGVLPPIIINTPGVASSVLPGTGNGG